MKILQILGWTAASIGLLIPLGSYGISQLQRPQQTPLTQDLFSGITYRRDVRHQPRPYVVHILKIDLTTPGLKVLATPGQPANDQNEFVARTTSAFLQKFQLQLAINAGYFYPFEERTPWDFTPQSGERVNVSGQSIAHGQQYSPSQRNWPVLCFDAKHQAQIVEAGICPPGTLHAIAGKDFLHPGQQSLQLDTDKPYARTVAALDQSGAILWLISIDGKQPYYSEGATMVDVGQIILELGAEVAINLDGGGSATLVTATPSGYRLLNAPIHSKWPMNERPVATHLGFYAQPKP
mgnify:CR=1 FL=1